MKKLFGTDGIRAVAGQYPLDFSSVFSLGSALISLLREEGYPPQVLIGRDTRESGIWLEKALFQGVMAQRGEAISVGIIPTSAVAFLTREFSVSAGIVISASHNPFQDNGIKIFTAKGLKISEEWENILEEAITKNSKDIKPEEFQITALTTLRKNYADFLTGLFSTEHTAPQMKVVVDCSNGASSALAPQILSDLGFEVVAINDSPDGKNINEDCGSLYPEKLAAAVKKENADIGIAYDGDADRSLWVDEKGTILNGDHTLYVLSKYMQKKGTLHSDTVVATIMSNMGLEVALGNMGLKLDRAQVGDKYVLERMLKINSNLGGEQSGHTILLDDCPTGDGILTSIRMLEAMVSHDAKLSELVSDYQEFPQVLKNVRVSQKEDFAQYPDIMEIVGTVEEKLGSTGRLNLRYSGTEPVARIMLEGQDQEKIEEYAQHIADIILKNLS